MQLSQWGLEPDGRRAHLIPFRNNKRGTVECQLILDYKGLVELAMRSGTVANIHADVVCENDQFSYDCGEITSHRIDFRKPRGEPYAVYARCKFKDLTAKCEVMSRSEVESIRARSKAAHNGPWNTDWNEMAKKTVFKRLSKWLTLSPEFRDAVEMDETAEQVLVKSVATAQPLFEIPPPEPVPIAAPVFETPKPAVEDDLNYDLGKTDDVSIPEPMLAPEPEPAPEPRKSSNQELLAEWWTKEVKGTFDDFLMVLESVKDTSCREMTGFEDMHGNTAAKFLRAKAGLAAEYARIFPVTESNR